MLLSSGLVAAGGWADRLLSTLSMAGIAAGLACNAIAFDLWCGREAVARAPMVTAVVMTLGYCIGFDHYAFRVGWANGLLTLQLAMVLATLCRTPRVPVGHWRWLLVISLLVQMAVTAARGVLGAFFHRAVPPTSSRRIRPTCCLRWPQNVTVVMSLVAILLAHRDEAARELETAGQHRRRYRRPEPRALG